MAKHTFSNEKSKVLPTVGEFITPYSAASIRYTISNRSIKLTINSQSLFEEDLKEFIEFLQSVKEHLE